MPIPTYTALATVTLGSTTSSVTFGSIPATYRDLVLIVDCKHISTGGIAVIMRFNGDSSNYSRVLMYGDGSSVASLTSTELVAQFNDNTNNSIGVSDIMDYSATDKHKTILTKTNWPSSGGFVTAQAQRWASTSAITSINVFYSGTNIASGSTFSLYGVIA